jgi:hypothetical protein
VLVDSWAPHTITAESIRSWRDQLAPYYNEPSKRTQVLSRLNSDFWWSKVVATYEGRLEEFNRNIPSIAITGDQTQTTAMRYFKWILIVTAC